MDAHTAAVLLLGGAGLAGVLWTLHKIGQALIRLFEALAAVAVVFVTLWWLIKTLVWLVRQLVTHWRTSLTALAVVWWWRWWDWPSLLITLAMIAAVLGVWRWVNLVSFDAWAGRRIRAWWQRWTLYAPRLPGWLHACGLSIRDEATPMAVTVNLVGRRAIHRTRQRPGVRIPTVVGVRSGASWDEVRMRLVPGQKPEDFDDAARALASARGVARCQIRELRPNVVSIDFQRRDLLADPVAGPDLAELAAVEGSAVDLRRVLAGRTEYGNDWHIPLAGAASHTLTAGAPYAEHGLGGDLDPGATTTLRLSALRALATPGQVTA